MKQFLRVWRISIGAIFFLLCLRFQLATFYETGRGIWALEFLNITSLVLGIAMQGETIFAFTAAVPLLGGLDHIFPCYGQSPVLMTFSAIYIGGYIREILQGNGKPQDTVSIVPYGIDLVADLFLSCIVAALALQLISHRNETALWEILRTRSNVAFSDPYYFLSSAFLWISGIYFFRSLCAQGPNLASWIAPILLIWGLISFLFFSFQFITDIPGGWVTGYFSPFEDISSFGSITVSILIFTLASLSRNPSGHLPWKIMFIVLLASMVAASWSRATWLVAIIGIPIVLLFRASPTKAVVGFVCFFALIYVVDKNASRPSLHNNPYIARLGDLFRVEVISNKSPERMNIYYKAFEMIKERPIVGHGIGSFYLKSRLYAKGGDPLADVPNFAHNAWLEIAAELGIPVALLFATFNVMIFGEAFHLVRRYPTSTHAHIVDNTHQIAAVEAKGIESQATNRSTLVLLGVALAFVAYLSTQMTANSLNVYASNQILFWFTAAGALATCYQIRLRSLQV